MDGHAFSTSEKLHVSVGEELLHDTSGMLSRYDDEKTDSSSDEDEEIQSILGLVYTMCLCGCMSVCGCECVYMLCVWVILGDLRI